VIRAAAAVMLTLAIALPAAAQTTRAPGIDVEIYDPGSGRNYLCVAPGEGFWANVWIRPGPDSASCSASCSPPEVPGGSAHLATAVIDIAFDPGHLSFAAIENNPEGATVDGLPQEQNADHGRIGWALAGDWVEDGRPSSGLEDLCAMHTLSREGWAFRVRFTARSEGMTTLHLRRAGDTPAFTVSFADMCSDEPFTEANGGIDELGDAVVLVSADCGDVLLYDSFDRADTAVWSSAVGAD
jgi:hypothetical protein